MRRRHAAIAGKLVVAAALLLLVYRRVSLDDVALDVRRLEVWPVVGFFSILFLNTLVSALKWKWLLQADGIRLSLLTLFGSYLIGSFFNLFLPSTVGGDTYRVASIGRGRIAKSAAAVLADRLSGLIALAAICVVFSVITYRAIGHHGYIVVAVSLFGLLMGIAFSLLWPAGSRRILTRLGLKRIPRFDRVVERLFLSFQSYRDHRTLIGRTIGLSLLFHFLVVIAVFSLSRSLALAIPFVYFLVFVPIITILESIPISIYGLGLRDAGYVFFFKEVGLPAAEAHALGMSVLYVGLTAAYAALGGLLLGYRLLTQRTPRATSRAAAAAPATSRAGSEGPGLVTVGDDDPCSQDVGSGVAISGQGRTAQ
jgi:hypothetical protein